MADSYAWIWAPVMTALGTVVWGVRLEGRVNAHDQKFEAQAELADERHEDVKLRLTRIESKLDNLKR